MPRWLYCLPLLLSLGVSTARAEPPDSPIEQVEDTPPSEPTADIEIIERPPMPSRSQLTTERLRNQYPEQFIEIPAQDSSIPALYLPANAPQAKGLIVLIPGHHESADASNIAWLRSAVTDKGWNSLSLQFPDPAFAALRITSKVPPAIESPELPEQSEAEQPDANAHSPLQTNDEHVADAEPDSAEIPNDEAQPEAAEIAEEEPSPATHAETIDGLLSAVLEYSQQQRQANESLIFITQHESAYWLLKHLSDKSVAPVDAVILINPRYPASPAERFANFISNSQTTTVDLYISTLHGQAEEARLRLNASLRNPHNNRYQQFKISAPDQLSRQQHIQRKVLGWLHNYP